MYMSEQEYNETMDKQGKIEEILQYKTFWSSMWVRIPFIQVGEGNSRYFIQNSSHKCKNIVTPEKEDDNTLTSAHVHDWYSNKHADSLWLS